MSTTPLPISRLIAVSVALTEAAVQALNQQSLMILGNSPVIDTKQRYRTYNSLDSMGLDFSDSDPEWLAAQAWFAQSPQPTQVKIGRWAQTATSGILVGGSFSSAQQITLLAALTAISTGSFNVTIDGVAHPITALDFTADTTLQGCAATIQAALPGGVLCTWVANQGYFLIQSSTTGAASTVSFLTAEGTGVDVSATLQMTNANGAYTVDGIVAETALAAVTLFDTNFGTTWYNLFICGASDNDHLAVAAYIEASSNYHFYGVSTQEAGVISSVSTTDIAYKLSQVGYKRTASQYSSSTPYAVVSLIARIATTDYTQNSSVINLMYKQEPIIAPEFLTEEQIDTLEAKNCNVFVAYNNNTAIIEPGVTTKGAPWYIDVTMGLDALVLGIQTALFNALYSTPTKIPQTDAGMHTLATAIEGQCIQFVNDGLLAAGTWTGQAIGSLNTGDYLSKGYFVYAPPVASQPESQRSQRISVPFQVAAKLAGAVNKVDVSVTVNN
jgi:hypothetical protein